MPGHSTRTFGPGDREPLRVGDEAPSFELRRTFEESVSLNDLTSAGPVIICFYVFDFGNI